MVESMVSVVVISLVVWVSIPHMGTLEPLGSGFLAGEACLGFGFVIHGSTGACINWVGPWDI